MQVNGDTTLGQRYVQHVYRTYGRSGTLWEGRFRSCLAQSERYVLACYRTIELNPQPRRHGEPSPAIPVVELPDQR